MSLPVLAVLSLIPFALAGAEDDPEPGLRTHTRLHTHKGSRPHSSVSSTTTLATKTADASPSSSPLLSTSVSSASGVFSSGIVQGPSSSSPIEASRSSSSPLPFIAVAVALAILCVCAIAFGIVKCRRHQNSPRRRRVSASPSERLRTAMAGRWFVWMGAPAPTARRESWGGESVVEAPPPYGPRPPSYNETVGGGRRPRDVEGGEGCEKRPGGDAQGDMAYGPVPAEGRTASPAPPGSGSP
ncbi:hypothetical protein MKEN_00993900 [Mycena kentingensis (nom. inval.)]|nr:hypothetical protein MKEN_00993900 [Mycena kentingensis (nom. inval.)]